MYARIREGYTTNVKAICRKKNSIRVAAISTRETSMTRQPILSEENPATYQGLMVQNVDFLK